jgi:hypothetical protein
MDVAKAQKLAQELTMALQEIYFKWFRGFVQNKQDPVLHVYVYFYKVITY